LCRPELGITLTKLFAWKLTQYRKAVFIDADCLVIRNVDELFERDELSAAPDVGWVDLFNSGVFVLRPSDDTFAALMQFAERHGSFDGVWPKTRVRKRSP
jgi:glycogenin glucosyltransferase